VPIDGSMSSSCVVDSPNGDCLKEESGSKKTIADFFGKPSQNGGGSSSSAKKANNLLSYFSKSANNSPKSGGPALTEAPARADRAEVTPKEITENLSQGQKNSNKNKNNNLKKSPGSSAKNSRNANCLDKKRKRKNKEAANSDEDFVENSQPKRFKSLTPRPSSCGGDSDTVPLPSLEPLSEKKPPNISNAKSKNSQPRKKSNRKNGFPDKDDEEDFLPRSESDPIIPPTPPPHQHHQSDPIKKKMLCKNDLQLSKRKYTKRGSKNGVNSSNCKNETKSLTTTTPTTINNNNKQCKLKSCKDLHNIIIVVKDTTAKTTTTTNNNNDSNNSSSSSSSSSSSNSCNNNNSCVKPKQTEKTEDDEVVLDSSRVDGDDVDGDDDVNDVDDGGGDKDVDGGDGDKDVGDDDDMMEASPTDVSEEANYNKNNNSNNNNKNINNRNGGPNKGWPVPHGVARVNSVLDNPEDCQTSNDGPLPPPPPPRSPSESEDPNAMELSYEEFLLSETAVNEEGKDSGSSPSDGTLGSSVKPLVDDSEEVTEDKDVGSVKLEPSLDAADWADTSVVETVTTPASTKEKEEEREEGEEEVDDEDVVVDVSENLTQVVASDNDGGGGSNDGDGSGGNDAGGGGNDDITSKNQALLSSSSLSLSSSSVTEIPPPQSSSSSSVSKVPAPKRRAAPTQARRGGKGGGSGRKCKSASSALVGGRAKCSQSMLNFKHGDADAASKICKPPGASGKSLRGKAALKPALESSLKHALEPSVESSLKPSLESSLEPSLKPSLKASLKPALKASFKPALKATLKRSKVVVSKVTQRKTKRGASAHKSGAIPAATGGSEPAKGKKGSLTLVKQGVKGQSARSSHGSSVAPKKDVGIGRNSGRKKRISKTALACSSNVSKEGKKRKFVSAEGSTKKRRSSVTLNEKRTAGNSSNKRSNNDPPHRRTAKAARVNITKTAGQEVTPRKSLRLRDRKAEDSVMVEVDDEGEEDFVAGKVESKEEKEAEVVVICKKTPQKGINMKLAPIFMAPSKKTTTSGSNSKKGKKVETEQDLRRRAFLMSGLPEEAKRQQTMNNTVSAVSCEYAPFPSHTHVRQVEQPSGHMDAWGLPEVALPLCEALVKSIELKCRWEGSLCAITLTPPQPDVTVENLKKFTKHAPLPASQVERILQEICSANPSYPARHFYEMALKRNKLAEKTERIPPKTDSGTTTTTTDDSRKGSKRKSKRGLGRRKSHKEAVVVVFEDEEEKKRQQRAVVAEERVCDIQWTEKYQPLQSSEIVGNGGSVRKLKCWMLEWKQRTDREARKLTKLLMKQKRQKKKSKDDDSNSAMSWKDDDSDFAVSPSDSEEDSLCNTKLLTGPPGAGKTAAVYALAAELGYQVFEMNASSIRSGKKILTRLQEATQSHQVSKDKSDSEAPPSTLPSFSPFFKSDKSSVDSSKVGTLPSNKRKRSNNNNNNSPAPPEREVIPRCVLRKSSETGVWSKVNLSECDISNNTNSSTNSVSTDNNKAANRLNIASTSLILFDEVDIVFEEDKGFWPAILQFMSSTKRPIILTATTADFSEQFKGSCEPLHFHTPSNKTLTSHLQTLCLAEAVVTRFRDLSELVTSLNGDIRSCLLAVQFWVESGASGSPVEVPLSHIVGPSASSSSSSSSSTTSSSQPPVEDVTSTPPPNTTTTTTTTANTDTTINNTTPPPLPIIVTTPTTTTTATVVPAAATTSTGSKRGGRRRSKLKSSGGGIGGNNCSSSSGGGVCSSSGGSGDGIGDGSSTCSGGNGTLCSSSGGSSGSSSSSGDGVKFAAHVHDCLLSVGAHELELMLLQCCQETVATNSPVFNASHQVLSSCRHCYTTTTTMGPYLLCHDLLDRSQPHLTFDLRLQGLKLQPLSTTTVTAMKMDADIYDSETSCDGSGGGGGDGSGGGGDGSGVSGVGGSGVGGGHDEKGKPVHPTSPSSSSLPSSLPSFPTRDGSRRRRRGGKSAYPEPMEVDGVVAEEKPVAIGNSAGRGVARKKSECGGGGGVDAGDVGGVGAGVRGVGGGVGDSVGVGGGVSSGVGGDGGILEASKLESSDWRTLGAFAKFYDSCSDLDILLTITAPTTTITIISNTTSTNTPANATTTSSTSSSGVGGGGGICGGFSVPRLGLNPSLRGTLSPGLSDQLPTDVANDLHDCPAVLERTLELAALREVGAYLECRRHLPAPPPHHPSPPHPSTAAAAVVSSSWQQDRSVSVSRQKAVENILDVLPPTHLLCPPFLFTDYLPALRCICRTEKMRQLAKVKRRFFHYFDNINFPLRETTLNILSSDFV
ncbi:hypothetical protein Ahia01_000980400, partial [Argonauta hians]